MPTDIQIKGQGVMREALVTHKPVKVYACFSGGHDSLVSTHFAMANGAQEVLHINTGIGIPQTREFVRETCKQLGWPLREQTPPNATYRDFVLKYGFPGPAAHRYSYSWLKERALRLVVREAKQHRLDRVAFVTGVRTSESARRMGFVQPIQRQGAQVWVAPIHHFTKRDCVDYMEANGLPRSPVVDLLHMSGECLCGAFSHKGEIKEIEMWFPDTAKEIHALEQEVKDVGQQRCIWGGKRGEKPSEKVFMPMCVGCDARLSENA